MLYAYKKGRIILDIGVDLYLSCIPANWDWFEELYRAHRHFSFLEDDIKIEHFSVEPLRFLTWFPSERQKTKLEILGGIRREGFGLSQEDRKTDMFSGIIVNNSSFVELDYHVNEAWNIHPRPEFFPIIKNPLHVLNECIISITNPVPYCDEVELGKIIDVDAPAVKMFLFDAYGATIFGITIHSTGPEIERE